MSEEEKPGYPTERLKGEGAKPYRAFRTYLDLGEKRSQEKVAKKLSISRQLVGRWSTTFFWKERLIRFDYEEAEREKAAAEQAALEKAREKLDRQTKVQESAFELFATLRQKVVDMLKFPVARQTITTDEGKTTTIIEPMKWRFSDVARVAEVADQLGRLATGLPTSNGRLAIGGDRDGAPLQPLVGPTLIQVTIARAKDAKVGHDYELLQGEEEPEEKHADAIEIAS